MNKTLIGKVMTTIYVYSGILERLNPDFLTDAEATKLREWTVNNEELVQFVDEYISMAKGLQLWAKSTNFLIDVLSNVMLRNGDDILTPDEREKISRFQQDMDKILVEAKRVWNIK